MLNLNHRVKGVLPEHIEFVGQLIDAGIVSDYNPFEPRNFKEQRAPHMDGSPTTYYFYDGKKRQAIEFEVVEGRVREFRKFIRGYSNDVARAISE